MSLQILLSLFWGVLTLLGTVWSFGGWPLTSVSLLDHSTVSSGIILPQSWGSALLSAPPNALCITGPSHSSWWKHKPLSGVGSEDYPLCSFSSVMCSPYTHGCCSIPLGLEGMLCSSLELSMQPSPLWYLVPVGSPCLLPISWGLLSCAVYVPMSDNHCFIHFTYFAVASFPREGNFSPCYSFMVRNKSPPMV